MKLNFTAQKQSLMLRRRHDLLKRMTPAELHVKALLEALPVKFTPQKCFSTEKSFFIVDFYLPAPVRLCLEIDGGYHEAQEEFDAWRTRLLTLRNVRVARLTNAQAIALNAESLAEFIRQS